MGERRGLFLLGARDGGEERDPAPPVADRLAVLGLAEAVPPGERHVSHDALCSIHRYLDSIIGVMQMQSGSRWHGWGWAGCILLVSLDPRDGLLIGGADKARSARSQ